MQTQLGRRRDACIFDPRFWAFEEDQAQAVYSIVLQRNVPLVMSNHYAVVA